MKKLFLLPAILLAAISCSDTTEKYVIDGSVRGESKNGESKNYAVLERRDVMFGFVPVDTADIKNNKFVFEGKASEPGLFYVNIDGKRATIILEKGTIHLDFHRDTVVRSKVSGTYNNNELAKFTAESIKYQNKLLEFRNVNKERIDNAKAKSDTAEFRKLNKELAELRMSIDQEVKDFNDKYIKENPESFISVLIIDDYLNRYRDNIQIVEEAYSHLSASMKNTRLGRSIAEEIEKAKIVEVGERAPDFSASTPDGKKVSLMESIGTVTIIDFWASWCGPCRKENPNVVKLYNEFKDKGLKIVGVSLDKDEAKWKDAIAKDGLAWTHVSNLKEWNEPIAKLYGVEEIPATFVLNQYGVVVAKNLKGEELRKKVSELLNKKAPK